MKASRSHRAPHGQALTEFALIVPLLVIVFIGVIEFGRFVLAYETLNNATREGARYAIVHGGDSVCPSGPMPGGGTSPSSCADQSCTNVINRVVQYGFTLRLVASQVAITYGDRACGTAGNGDNARGSSVTVTTNYTFSTILPVPLLHYRLSLGSRHWPST